MFDSGGYEALRDSACALASARDRTALATGSELCDAVRAVQQAQDVLDGVSADLLARMDDLSAYEDEGASSLSSWMCRELRIPRVRVRARVKAGHTLRRLPAPSDALSRGRSGWSMCTSSPPG